MSILRTDREGFALAGAVLALVVVGALVSVGFYAASQEGRMGMSSRFGTAAFYAAERGLHEVIGSNEQTFFNAIPLGGESTIGPVALADGAVATSYTVRIRHIGDRLFFVESTGRVTGGGVYSGDTRRVGMLVRTLALSLPEARAAIQVFGKIRFEGSPTVTGFDTIPANWADCGTKEDVAGVLAQDATYVTHAGAKDPLSGDPRVEADPSLTSDDFFVFGDMTWSMLVSLANKVYAPGAMPKPNPLVQLGKCSTSTKDNWGDPKNVLSACHYYFPIIYGQGNLTLDGNGYGQGILLVEGDLSFAGTVEFFGIVVVKGRVNPMPGSGNGKINGTMLVYNKGELVNVTNVYGNPKVTYSHCAVDRAIQYADWGGQAFPVAERSWIDLSSAGALAY